MNKIISLLLACVLAASMCACSRTKETNTDGTDPALTEEGTEDPEETASVEGTAETDIEKKGEVPECLGRPFPDFTVTDTDGNTFILSEALKDHEAVLINIFATWCGPCQLESPFLEEAYEKYGDRAAFIVISGDPNDTLDMVRDFGRDFGLKMPMGLDENRIMESIGANAYPTTVIVDRFGNAAFFHSGSFISFRDVSVLIEHFLGDGYTETSVLNEIPLPDRTSVFPAASSRDVFVDNESARELFFINEEQPDIHLKAYIVNDDTAHVRLQSRAIDNPYYMMCYHSNEMYLHSFASLLDEKSASYLFDAPIPEENEDPFFAGLYVTDFSDDDPAEAISVYLIRSEDALDKLCQSLAGDGWKLSEENVEELAKEEPLAYVLHVFDQYGNPVPDMIVNFCTDQACAQTQSDENGIISFDGAEDNYHIQLLKAPEGYSFDPDFEFYTGKKYGQWRLLIRKDS